MKAMINCLLAVILFSGSVLYCQGLKDIKTPQEFVKKIQELRKLDIRNPSIINIFKENMPDSPETEEIIASLKKNIAYGVLSQRDIDQAIVGTLKANIEKGLSIENLVDNYKNTVLHESLYRGDIDTTRVILESLESKQERSLLKQQNSVFDGSSSHEESYFGETPFLFALRKGKVEQALELLDYAEIDFGESFARKMVLATNCHQSFSLHYELSFPLACRILFYLKNDDIRKMVNIKNDSGATPLRNVRISTMPIGYYQEQSIHPPVVLAFALRFQAQYKMSFEEVCKEFYGDYGEKWRSFYDALKQTEDRYLLKF